MSDQQQLPEFEGTIPVGIVTALNGASQRITRPMHIGDRGVLLVEYEVGAVNHRHTKDGLKRHQVLSVSDAWEIDPDVATEQLRKARNAARAEQDDAMGRTPLLDDTVPAAQYVTSGGVPMTPMEIAEARGETWDAGDEITVVFADGGRSFWPDDWAGTGQSLAPVGGFMRVVNGDPGEVAQVVQLLDPESAAVLAEWTSEDEEAREGAEAAREDREAMPARAEDVDADDLDENGFDAELDGTDEGDLDEDDE